MRLLVDIVAKKWILENSNGKEAVWMHTCWEMYKKVPDESSRVLLQGAIDKVIELSNGIIMIKTDTPEEEKWLKENGA